MSYFRQPKKPNNNPNAIDGFISRPAKSDAGSRKDVQSRFRTSYTPNSMSEKPRKADEFSTVASRQTNSSIENNERAFDNNFERQASITNTYKFDEPEKQKRRLFRRKNNKTKNKQGNFKKASKAFAVVLIALVIGVGSLFGYGYIKARNIFKGDGEGAAALQKNVDPAKLNGEGDGRVNILMIGKGGPGHEGADLTDTLLLASIDPVQNEAALVSVPRDMYVQTESGYETKINAVYSLAKQARLANGEDTDADIQAAEDAGLSAIKRSVSEVLGVPVHYYAMVDFTAFEEAVDTVGGITIDVKTPVYEQMRINGKNYILDVPVGLQSFDGERALAYARCRKCGDGRSDFGRNERQREVIVALQQKSLTVETFANPFKIVDLLNSLGSNVRTDLNGLDELKRLYEIGQNITSDKVISIGLDEPPNVLVATGNINGQSIVRPVAGLFQYDEIRSYIRNTIRDPYLKMENARVLILNGTEVAGLATATMEELKSYGYNVLDVDNAPTSDYINNMLIDNTTGDKRYTKSYLERRVGLSATSNRPAGIPGVEEADFVIILGTDEVTKTSN
jgi:LCP family protein required for cell wall assembly